MTVTYNYLGYGVTDSNGVAKLDHDADGEEISHSYTGTGAGEIDVIASLDNASTISDSSIQSEPYTVLDGIFKDLGTETTAPTWTSDDFTGADLERNGEYVALIPSASFEAYLT